jgi:hypothetical protein
MIVTKNNCLISFTTDVGSLLAIYIYDRMPKQHYIVELLELYNLYLIYSFYVSALD